MDKHKTKDGKIIAISEMEDSHLLNTIALIKRLAKNGLTIRSGGGYSVDEFWYDEYTIWGKEVKEKTNYKAYKKEAKKRGIIK